MKNDEIKNLQKVKEINKDHIKDNKNKNSIDEEGKN